MPILTLKDNLSKNENSPLKVYHNCMTDFSGRKIVSREVSLSAVLCFVPKILKNIKFFGDLRQRWNYRIKTNMMTSEGAHNIVLNLKQNLEFWPFIHMTTVFWVAEDANF